MDIIISLLIVSVLIGIPTWLIVHTVNKADKSTIIYSPEEVTRRLRKGFYLSFWGMDLLFGAIPSFVLILCDLPTVFQFIVPAVAFIVGFIMFFIGTTLIISKKPGNTGISRDIRTEFTTDLLLSD